MGLRVSCSRLVVLLRLAAARFGIRWMRLESIVLLGSFCLLVFDRCGDDEVGVMSGDLGREIVPDLRLGFCIEVRSCCG